MDASDVGKKQCSTCKEWKPLEEFNRRSKSRDGRQWNCRLCNAAHHQINKVRHNAQIHARARRIANERYQRIRQYFLEHPCVDCGETDLAVLEFDHQRDKVANISWLVRNHSDWNAILREIEKCEVRCANCHRRRTLTLQRSWRIFGFPDAD